jgi:sec-independent protein translocase protein TatA
MFGLGTMEILVLLVLGLLLFGKNLPDLARSLGRTVVEFRKGMHGLEDDLRRDPV